MIRVLYLEGEEEGKTGSAGKVQNLLGGSGEVG